MSQQNTESTQEQAPTPQRIASKSLSWPSVAKSLVAGGFAGGLSRTAVAPLERLKILMQVQGTPKVYTGTVQGLTYMMKNEGIRGMFKGNGTNCVRIVPNAALKFLTYEQLTRRISYNMQEAGGDGQMTPLLRLTAGAVAGIIGMSATYPLDMVRGRLTVQTDKQYRGILHATRLIIKQEGLIALWRGWLPSVIGVVPYMGLNFAVYETLKDLTLKAYDLNDERELSVLSRLACGAVAGTTGQTVAYPLDVVRRRLQVSGWVGAARLHAEKLVSAGKIEPKEMPKVMSGWQGAQNLHAEQGHAVIYKGMMDCFVRTVKEEGVSALFKGLLPNYIKVVPSIAIAFVSYEQVKELLGVEMRIST